MKSLVALSIALAFVAITECSVQLPFSEADLEFFKNIKFEQLPKDLKIALRKSVRDGSGNWCCVNNVPIKSIQRTKVGLSNVKVKTTVKVGYTKCKFLGMGMCPLYDVRYTTKPEYHLEYYEVPDSTTCKEIDIRCCDGHVPMAGTCLALSEAAKYTEALLKLKEAGFMDPVG